MKNQLQATKPDTDNTHSVIDEFDVPYNTDTSLDDANTFDPVAFLLSYAGEDEHILGLKEQAEQLELFPDEKPQREVYLKKSLLSCMGGTDAIRGLYPDLLSIKLLGGKTLSQYLDRIDNWFLQLTGRDLGNWIKVFAFIQSVQKSAAEHQQIAMSGIFSFPMKLDKKFYAHFIEPDQKKKDGTPYYSTKAKERIEQWLEDNQDALKVPQVIVNDPTADGHTTINPAALPVYQIETKVDEYTKEVSKTFYANTNVIDTMFRDYGRLNTTEIEPVYAAWEAHSAKDEIFKKYRLSSFEDIPIKFLICLTQIYSRLGEFTAKNGYKGTVQRLSAEALDKHLGCLKRRVIKHLHISDKGGNAAAITSKILRATFEIAVERNWLAGMPKVTGTTYTFFFNPYYFDKRRTAIRLIEKNDTYSCPPNKQKVELFAES